MKMNGAGIAEVSEKGTVGKSVEVFGDCCSRISSFCSLWDFVFSSNAFKRKSSVYLVPRFLPVIYLELDIVCADMRSSSYEAALTRFEARLNSPQLSDVVRGLIGVLRGDDGAVYFQMLTHDFKQAELQRLKAKAAKIPPKIRFFSFAMLLCFLATYFAIIGYEIIKSMGTLF